MTKKDYVLLAGALKEARAVATSCVDGIGQDAMIAGIECMFVATVGELVRVCKADNSKFDADRFRAACE